MVGVESSLSEVERYDHPALVERLEDKLGLPRAEAARLFDDTKRFLFLCGTIPDTLVPPERIDECWHHFILYTRDYADFCDRYFGRFIHHLPKTRDEMVSADGKLARNTRRYAQKVLGENLSRNWDYSYDPGGKCTDKCNPSTNCQDKPTCAKPACDSSDERVSSSSKG